MPVTATCPKCGKALRVKDELVGKRVRCPGCGETFPVGAGGGGGGATRYDPNASAAAKQKREKAAGNLSISWGPIFLIGFILLIAVGVGVFMTGPKRVWNEWEKIGPDAADDSKDVISLGLQAYLSKEGYYNPRKGHNTPEAKEIMFYRPTMVMSMPETVEFRGVSNEGPFKGKYHPNTGEVEADVNIGASVSVLSGKVKEGATTIQVTGRRKNGVVTAEVNGAKAVIIFPPKDD